MQYNQFYSKVSLTKNQKTYLKKLAHHLTPVVIIGQAGLSPPVIAEINEALTVHELLKVKIHKDDRKERTAIIERMTKKCEAENIMVTGKISVIYKPTKQNKVLLPNS